mmetsp:Transcript_26591/g.84629  ORF Transcript_26591/g.84629 Transcript_26591/m.84629 type:complete len:211 (-) Transcript_26591:77-709(-)
MQAEAVLPGQSPGLVHVRRRERDAAARVVRILEQQEARPGVMHVLASHCSLHLGQIERPVRFVREHPCAHVGESAHVAPFVQVRVLPVADDDFRREHRAAVLHDCNEVACRPSRHKERRFLAELLRGLLLQQPDRRVFLEYVVAERCVRHRLVHGLGRPSHGIRSKVDHAAHRPWSQRRPRSLAVAWRSPPGLSAARAACTAAAARSPPP